MHVKSLKFNLNSHSCSFQRYHSAKWQTKWQCWVMNKHPRNRKSCARTHRSRLRILHIKQRQNDLKQEQIIARSFSIKRETKRRSIYGENEIRKVAEKNWICDRRKSGIKKSKKKRKKRKLQLRELKKTEKFNWFMISLWCYSSVCLINSEQSLNRERLLEPSLCLPHNRANHWKKNNFCG